MKLLIMSPSPAFCHFVDQSQYSHQNPIIMVIINNIIVTSMTALVVRWPEFLAANPEVPGSILGAARFF
jgi:hypothetical protein